MKQKKRINENIFSAAKRFSDAFFDGLKTNTANRVLSSAKKAGIPKEAIEIMDNIKKDKEYLDSILEKISKS